MSKTLQQTWCLLLAIGLLLGEGSITATKAQTSTLTLPVVTSWLGNSFGDAVSIPASPFDPDFGVRVQMDGDSLFTTPDGTCFVVTDYDEGGHPVGWYDKNGNMLGAERNETAGWGFGNCNAIVADDQYIYVAQTQDWGYASTSGTVTTLTPYFTGTNVNGLATNPPTGSAWTLISRHSRTKPETTAPWSTAYGPNAGNWDCELVVNTVPTGTTVTTDRIPITETPGGLGIDNTRAWLYVSDPYSGQIKIYNKTTMSSTPVATYPLTNPGRIAVAPDESIWVTQPYIGTTPGDVVHFTVSSSGSFTPTGTITDCADPSAIAIASTGTILLADHGQNNQVRIYDSNGNFQSTFGATGGIYSAANGHIPGQLGPQCFNGLNGLGTDSNGNVYITEKGARPSGAPWTVGYGLRIESYPSTSSTATLTWALNGLMWANTAQPDPLSENDMYTQYQHFTMDYTKDTSQGKEANYDAHTLDPYTYPDDPRLHFWTMGEDANDFVGSVSVRRIGGQLFLYASGMGPDSVEIYRFNPGSDIAIPCAMITEAHVTDNEPTDNDSGKWPLGQPATGAWIWRDGSNGGKLDGAFDPSGVEYQSAPAKNLFETSGDQRGMFVDSAGNVWWTNTTGSYSPAYLKFFEVTCQGVDANGVPEYDYNHVRYFSSPISATPTSTFTNLARVLYIPSTDTVYLTGYTTASPNPGGLFGKVGSVIDAYPNWTSMTGTATGTFTGTLTPAWECPIAQTGTSTSPVYWPDTIDIAGRYAFVGYYNNGAYYADRVEVRDLNNHGNYVGDLVPGPSVGTNISDIDMSWGLRAFQRGNGEYIITHEDDRYGKIVLYRWLAPATAFTNPWGNYDAKVTPVLPTGATPAWTYSSGSGTAETSVSNIVNEVVPTGTTTAPGSHSAVTTITTGTVTALNMNTTASGSITFAYGARGSFNFNEANGYTVEFSAQCDSYSGVGLGVDQGFSMKVFGPTYMMEASINTSQIAIRGGGTYTIPGGLSGSPHLFRFIKHSSNNPLGANLYDVYVDGVVIQQNVPAIVNGVGGGMINFGDSSGGSSCNATLYDVYADTSGAK